MLGDRSASVRSYNGSGIVDETCDHLLDVLRVTREDELFAKDPRGRGLALFLIELRCVRYSDLLEQMTSR